MTRNKFVNIFLLILVSGLFARSAERVVSLAPSLTKNIYLLEAGDKLVGCTSYCNIAVSENKQVIGSAIAVNIEKTLTLKPDLIIATKITNPETIETFKKLGIRVEVYASPVNFNGICEQLISLGEIIEKKDMAFAIVNREKRKLDSIKQTIPVDESPRIFFQIGTNPVFTVLNNTFMNDFIRFSGGVNICEDFRRGTVSRETVVLRDPDVILVSDMGKIGLEEKKIWEGFKELKAVKNNKVIIVDSDKSCSPTVTDFTETLGFIIDAIYNE